MALRIYHMHDGTTVHAVAAKSRAKALEDLAAAGYRVSAHSLATWGGVWQIGQVAGTDEIAASPGVVFEAPIGSSRPGPWKRRATHAALTEAENG